MAEFSSKPTETFRMPSFDAVLDPNLVEVRNAVDQTAKEIGTRFDFKGSSARVELKEKELTIYADSDFQIGQVMDILLAKMTKRSVDVRFLDRSAKVEKIGGDKVKQVVTVKRDREEDADRGQAEQAEGAGCDPGRHGSCDRREARRPADGDGAVAQGVAGRAGLLQQLQGIA
jgi:hypothetical protein